MGTGSAGLCVEPGESRNFRVPVPIFSQALRERRPSLIFRSQVNLGVSNDPTESLNVALQVLPVRPAAQHGSSPWQIRISLGDGIGRRSDFRRLQAIISSDPSIVGRRNPYWHLITDILGQASVGWNHVHRPAGGNARSFGLQFRHAGLHSLNLSGHRLDLFVQQTQLRLVRCGVVCLIVLSPCSGSDDVVTIRFTVLTAETPQLPKDLVGSRLQSLKPLLDVRSHTRSNRDQRRSHRDGDWGRQHWADGALRPWQSWLSEGGSILRWSCSHCRSP